MDLNNSIKDTLVGDTGISILDYHKNVGRKIEDEDQPVLYYRKGKYVLSHVPSLVRETPSMENLKRYDPRASKKAATISRRDPFSRYFEIEQNIEHLLENNIVHTTAEIIIGEIENTTFSRQFDKKAGFNELLINK